MVRISIEDGIVNFDVEGIERYQRLIVEVESPNSTLRALEKAYAPRK